MFRIVSKVFAVLLALAVLTIAALRMDASWREVETRDALLPAEGRLVETRFGQVYIEERGPEAGTPVLMIHGSVGWAGFWAETSTALAASGYRAIAMDLSPMGFTDHDPNADYSRATQSERIVAVADRLEIRPILLAHSFGAGPGMEALMRHPDRFRSAVIVAGAIGVGAAPKSLPLPLRAQWIREVAVSTTITNPLALRPLLAMFLHKKDRATRDYVEVLMRPYPREGTTREVANWLPTLLVPPSNAESTDPENYANLDLPVALIWGAEDTATPVEQGEWLHEAIKGSTLTVLPDLGHIPQIEDPFVFQRALLEALKRL